MSPHPAHPTDERDLGAVNDTARIGALLRRARARLAFSRLLRSVSLVAPVAIAAVTGLTWLRGFVDPSLVAGGAAAIVAAMLVAWFRTPDTAGVAALLDERLRLADRVGTAYHLLARNDEVARLIRHDAATRLVPAGVEAAFPLRVHPWAGFACIAVATSAGIWLVERPDDGSERLNPARGGGMLVKTPGADSRAAAGSSPTLARPEDSRPLRRETDPAAPKPGSPDVDAPSAAADQGSPESARSPADTAAQATPAGRNGASGRGRSGSGVTPGSRRDEGSADTVAPADGGAPAGATRQAGAGSGASQGAGDAGTSTRAAAAGGVQGGRALDPRSARREGLEPRVSADDIRRGQLRAEAAITHDDVPPRHRAYVREYFRTVQSMSEP